MKLSMISDSKTRVNFFPELADMLAEKIADIETEFFFVPFPEDIPAKAKEEIDANEAEIVFVFSTAKTNFRATLMAKLIDVELQTGKKIVKAIEKKGLEIMGKDKEELAKKWADFLIDYMYKPELFEPK